MKLSILKIKQESKAVASTQVLPMEKYSLIAEDFHK